MKWRDFESNDAKEAYNEISSLIRNVKCKPEDRGRLAARVMSDLVDGGGSGDMEGFVRYWESEHRTLQQSFTGLIAQWLHVLSKKEKLEYDLRNAYSVGFAKGAFEGLKDFQFTATETDGFPYNYNFEFNDPDQMPIRFPLI